MKVLNILGQLTACLCFVFIMLVGMYYGMGKEIERREAETAYHIQRCEADVNYYPDFCKHLLGE